jgi:hypothetical protein
MVMVGAEVPDMEGWYRNRVEEGTEGTELTE